MTLARIVRHVFAEGSARRRFPARALDAMQHAIAEGEKRHRGEVCIAIEGALPFADLWRGRVPRERAGDVFANLRVWDTQDSCGVLIYVLLADHAIEIVADRGVSACVDDHEWEAVCERLGREFARGNFKHAAVAAINEVSAILARHFPAGTTPQSNELPDRPELI